MSKLLREDPVTQWRRMADIFGPQFIMARIDIKRMKLFAIVTLTFGESGEKRRALMTMDRDIKADDPKIKAFKNRVLRTPPPENK